MRPIAVIPARGGSQRIPRKNIRSFHGKPIIAYSIQTAIESGLFDRIVVSTDDREIAEIAVLYGATDIHERRPEDAVNEVGTQEVMAKVLEDYAGLYEPEFVCCIYATAPLMLAKDLHKGLRILEADKDAAFVFPVGLEPTRDAGAWYWGRRLEFLRRYPMAHPASFTDPRIYKMVLPEERICDINTIEDLERAEALYGELVQKRSNADMLNQRGGM